MTRGDRRERRDRKSVIAAPLVIIKGARVEDEANKMMFPRRRFNSRILPETVRRRDDLSQFENWASFRR